MDEFLRALVEALKRVGVQDVQYPDPRPWSNYGYITVSGCEFNFSRRSGQRSSVRMEGKREMFRYPYKVAEVATEILKVLPKKIEERKKIVEQRKLYEEARDLNRVVTGTNLSMDAYNGKFRLTFEHADKSTIMAAADFLQDNGFCESSTPQQDEEMFAMNAARRLLYRLPPEQRQALIKEFSEQHCKE